MTELLSYTGNNQVNFSDQLELYKEYEIELKLWKDFVSKDQNRFRNKIGIRIRFLLNDKKINENVDSTYHHIIEFYHNRDQSFENLSQKSGNQHNNFPENRFVHVFSKSDIDNSKNNIHPKIKLRIYNPLSQVQLPNLFKIETSINDGSLTALNNNSWAYVTTKKIDIYTSYSFEFDPDIRIPNNNENILYLDDYTTIPRIGSKLLGVTFNNIQNNIFAHNSVNVEFTIPNNQWLSFNEFYLNRNYHQNTLSTINNPFYTLYFNIINPFQSDFNVTIPIAVKLIYTTRFNNTQYTKDLVLNYYIRTRTSNIGFGPLLSISGDTSVSINDFTRLSYIPYSFQLFSLTGLIQNELIDFSSSAYKGELIISISGDNDNVLFLENKETVQSYLFEQEIDEPKIEFNFVIENPLQINYDKTFDINYLIKYTNLTGTVENISSTGNTFQINVQTTYSLQNRYMAQNDVNIGILNLTPFIETSEIERGVYIPTINYKPNINFINTFNIILDDPSEKVRQFDISFTITGLKTATIKLEVGNTDNLIMFDGGDISVEYDLDSNDSINTLSIPIYIVNPLKENYSKEFDLLFSIFDGIDTYAEIFRFNLSTNYSLTQEVLREIIQKFVRENVAQLQKSISSLESSLNTVNESLISLDNNLLESINKSLTTVNVGLLTSTINNSVSAIFSDLTQSIAIDKYLQFNIYQEDISRIAKQYINIILLNIITNEKIQLSDSDFDVSNGKIVLNRVLASGRYVMTIEQKNDIVDEYAIKSINTLNNFSVLYPDRKIDKNYSNQKIKVKSNGDYYHIVYNTNDFFVVFPLYTDSNENIYTVHNLFDKQYFDLNISTYDINDVGSVFFNKKVTNRSTGEEQIFDDSGKKIVYDIIYTKDGNLTTREQK